MPFWLHEHRLTRLLKSIPFYLRIMSSIVFVGGVTGCWFLCCYLPLKHQLIQQQKKYQELIEQEKRLAPTVQHYASVVNEHNTLLAALEQRHATIQSPQQIMSSLVDMMQTCGMSCRGIKPQQVYEKDDYEIYNFVLRAKGEFNQLLSFLNQLHTHPMPITCTGLSIVRQYQKRLMITIRMRGMRVKEPNT